MLRAGVIEGIQLFLAADHVNEDQSLCQGHHGFQTVRQPGTDPLLHHQTIHHDLDVMLFVLVHGNFFAQLVHAAVHPDPYIAGAPCSLQFLGVLALPTPDDGRQQLEPGTLRQLQHLIHNLSHRLLLDFSAADGTVRDTNPGIQQTQIIVNLRNGAHRGAGVLGGGFLVDGNGRGQTIDAVHVRFFHLP